MDIAYRTNHLKQDFPYYIKATKDASINRIEATFKVISQRFYNAYLKLSNDNKEIFSLNSPKPQENNPHMVKSLRQQKITENNN